MQVLKKKFQSWQDSRATRRSLIFRAGYCLVVSTTLFSCSTPSQTTQQTTQQTAQQTAQQTTQEPASSPTSSGRKVVRIVRSKQLTPLAVLQKQGNLEKRLEPLGFKVEWPEFAAGPQQLEALNAGSLDIASTAESPPVFAQAAGTPLVYLTTTPFNGKTVSLLVSQNSPVKSVADLKGKKIAFQKASIGHYLLVKALEKEGLKLNDVTSVFLAPPDANVAFSQGKVDGWFIWEPFVTRTEQKKIGRELINGGQLRDTGNFYSTSRSFYQAHPDIIKIFFEELQKAEVWSKGNRKEMAQLLAPVTQLDVPTLEKMHSKYDWGLRPITEQVIKKQQEVADMWYSQKLIPKKVNVKDGFLTPEEYAKITPPEVLAKQ
ncbi:aliphatic sulfonates ABC transporter substrate-binding protein [Scytonema sp. HK-05]|uniref:aliphatic sulfonate ABC transporter substrate-binding protein n=1 Tax=Scytonema sp. HK-05 TaxID=1137095 RepID=UPI0009378A55|nr:aliphatic sulfonate ABC transporter substrate-binding protein [Scytonema sp. HK-05]OKH55892.1 aliphatic sulfonate ABC transporter substrate-binding protein [Scytonema sp. HK-05]BAY49538.1 aliphatic sulfonates ABC transporter substrate-binding protein [Scytonema sp. HK-05]